MINTLKGINQMYNFWGKRLKGEYYKEYQNTWKLFLTYNQDVVVYVSISNKL